MPARRPALSPSPGTYEPNTPWKLYNHLIGGIPEDIEVTDVCLGSHWCYVEAECGMGVSMLVRGGASRTYRQDLRGMKLREVAELSKSWSFPEATIGVAALNAWYAQPDKLDALGAVYEEPVELPDGSIRKLDAFETYREEYVGKKVIVVGHFPHVERVAEVADPDRARTVVHFTAGRARPSMRIRRPLLPTSSS